MDENKEYEEQEQSLSKKSAAFVQYLTRRGYLVSQRALNEDSDARRRQIALKAYHNTEMLLECYRDMVWALETIPDQIASELTIPFATLDEILLRVDVELAMNNRGLEERLYSITKSRLLIDRINEAVSMLKKKPKEGEDLYQVIYCTYISDEPHDSVWEVYTKLAMSKRRYYDLRKKAISLISLRLWSAPNKEINMWLDVLTMLDQLKD